MIGMTCVSHLVGCGVHPWCLLPVSVFFRVLKPTTTCPRCRCREDSLLFLFLRFFSNPGGARVPRAWRRRGTSSRPAPSAHRFTSAFGSVEGRRCKSRERLKPERLREGDSQVTNVNKMTFNDSNWPQFVSPGPKEQSRIFWCRCKTGVVVVPGVGIGRNDKNTHLPPGGS